MNGSMTSLPPPQPKSPPELYGRRRELAKVQMLEREIGFLEEELKSIEGLQLASGSCKEVAEFVTGNPDPLIPTTTKRIRRSCRFWKWLCGGVSCFKISWICCCSCPSPRKFPCRCDCNTCGSCRNRAPICSDCRTVNKCRCCSCWNSKCFKTLSKCSTICCCCCSLPNCPSNCPNCSSSTCCSSSSSSSSRSTCYPRCHQLINICSCCHKSCCINPCYYLCY